MLEHEENFAKWTCDIPIDRPLDKELILSIRLGLECIVPNELTKSTSRSEEYSKVAEVVKSADDT